jgi:hypothetical protein
LISRLLRSLKAWILFPCQKEKEKGWLPINLDQASGSNDQLSEEFHLRWGEIPHSWSENSCEFSSWKWHKITTIFFEKKIHYCKILFTSINSIFSMKN